MAVTTVKIEFGPWEPDAALMEGRHLAMARNVVPAARGYRPFHGFVDLKRPALPEGPLAAFSRRSGENLFTFAATQGGIYALENGAWKALHSGTALTQDRAFADYGSAVYALFGGRLLKSALEGGTASAFAPVQAAPVAEVLGVIRDFLVLGRLSEAPGGIRWSGLDRPDEWPEPGTDEAQYLQSDRQVFPSGGRVQAVTGGVGNADGLVFLEEAVYRASYVGLPYIFQFDHVDRRRGLLAPHSAVVCGGQCCFLSADGWYATDGLSLKPIGLGRVDRWFFENCAPSRLAETRGVYDAHRRAAVWTFASPQARDGLHDRALIYSCEFDRWSCAAFDCELLFTDWTRGLTLEELDAYGPLDSMSYASLDATALKNGRLGLFGFTPGHRLCCMEGEALEAVIDSAEYGNGRIFLHGFRPLVDAARIEAMPVSRTRPMDARRAGRYSLPDRDGLCPQRLSACRLAARLRIPAGQGWTEAVGVEAVLEGEG